MASKKNILALALIVLVQSIGMAQTDWGWDWKDTSKISVKKLPQHNEFINNQYPYPAQPRSQWELGFGLGASSITGDIKSKLGFGGTVSLRKALNHTFSIRTGLTGLWNSGTANAFQTAVGRPDYKNRTYQLGFDVIASLNAASHYRGNPKTNVYVLMGYALNASNVLYKDQVVHSQVVTASSMVTTRMKCSLIVRQVPLLHLVELPSMADRRIPFTMV